MRIIWLYKYTEAENENSLAVQVQMTIRKCRNYKTKGHFARDSWSKKNSSKDEQDKSKDERKCYKCGQEGQIAKFFEKNDKKSDHKEEAMTAIVKVLSTSECQSVKWILDFDSTSHMFNKPEHFITFSKKDGQVKVGNNNFIKSAGYGMMRKGSMINRHIHTFNLCNVIYATRPSYTLISIS